MSAVIGLSEEEWTVTGGDMVGAISVPVGTDPVTWSSGGVEVGGSDYVSGMKLATVSAQNVMNVSAGGTAVACSVGMGGRQFVYFEGTTSETSVAGGIQIVSGGRVIQTQVYGEGSQFIYSGGVAVDTFVAGYETNQYVSSGGVASGTSVYGGGSQHIYAGAQASLTTIDNSGVQQVYVSGIVRETTIADWGEQRVGSGGLAAQTTVNSGGILTVEGGGWISATTVNSGGRLLFADGANVLGELNVGGRIVTYGAVVTSGTTVALLVDQRTTSDGALIDNIYNLVDANYSITVSSTQGIGAYVLADNADGFTGSITVSNELSQAGVVTVGGSSVQIGSRSYWLAVNSDDSLLLGITEAAYQVTWSSGSTLVGGSNYVSGMVLESGGVQNVMNVSSGGTAVNIQIAGGGTQYVSSGGIASSASTANGGIQIVSGGMAIQTRLAGAGSQFIYANGVALDTFMENTGLQYVSSGGVASHTTVYGGSFQYLFGGAQATLTTISDSAEQRISGGVASETIIYTDGQQYVCSGGSAVQTTINSGGSMFVDAGGSASDVQINSGGQAMLASGGKIQRASVFAGGELFASGGGVLSGALVESGGRLVVSSYALAVASVVNSGGVIELESGAMISGTLGLGGMMTLSTSVQATGATITFLADQRSTADGVLIDNIVNIKGANYTVSVAAAQSTGLYALAAGAPDMSGAQYLVSDDQNNSATVTVNGGAVTIGGRIYSLLENYGTVSLATAVGAASSDINGDGLSDVTLQWSSTGGVGYWLDGTSRYQPGVSSVGSEWRVLGTYVMDSDADADTVLCGLIDDTYYVGYYKGGNGSDWQNIGSISSPDGNTWDLTVGDITGSGTNSVIWHNEQLGVVGAWCDGTDNWLEIARGYDAGWSMLGTGDFVGATAGQLLMVEETEDAFSFRALAFDGSFSDLGSLDNGWDGFTIGDFTGDGLDDVVALNTATNLLVRFENGDTSKWTVLGQIDASSWEVAGAGDYNGDGKDDLLLRQLDQGYTLGYCASADLSQWQTIGSGLTADWKVIA